MRSQLRGGDGVILFILAATEGAIIHVTSPVYRRNSCLCLLPCLVHTSKIVNHTKPLHLYISTSLSIAEVATVWPLTYIPCSTEWNGKALGLNIAMAVINSIINCWSLHYDVNCLLSWENLLILWFCILVTRHSTHTHFQIFQSWRRRCDLVSIIWHHVNQDISAETGSITTLFYI